MAIVFFTSPEGKAVAVNSEAWQTVLEPIGGPKGAHAQIGFAGPASSIFVRDAFNDVIAAFKKADEEDKKS